MPLLLCLTWPLAVLAFLLSLSLGPPIRPCPHVHSFQKQSACYFQAKSMQATITNNICFNGARAGIK